MVVNCVLLLLEKISENSLKSPVRHVVVLLP